MAKTEKTAEQNIPLPPVPLAQEEKNAPSLAPDSLSDKLGHWAFRHKDFFQSGTGSILFRNFLRTMVAIVPYAFVNIASQHFFHRTMNRENAPKLGFLTGIFEGGNRIMQNTVTIALSFTTFRTVSKIWNNNYDRIFRANSADEAVAAIRDLPKNMVKDATDIGPRELSATGLAAVTLGAVRSGLSTPTPLTHMREYSANALGYAAFFPVTDALYKGFEGRQKSKEADAEDLDAEHGKEVAISTTDTFSKVVFRNAASVFIAAVPYIWAQRKMSYTNPKWGRNYAPLKTPEGSVISKNDTYLKNLGICLAAFDIPFAIFTSGIELYQRAWDKLFQKVQEKEHVQNSQLTAARA